MSMTSLLRPALLSTLLLCAVAPAFAGVDISVRIGIPAPVVVTSAPPRIIHERVGRCPSDRHVWVPGHYVWMRHKWVWIRGSWQVPPRDHLIWVDGVWDGPRRSWIEGHWEERSRIFADSPPPPPHLEPMAPRPSPYHIWIAGYWGWHDGRHVWVGGHWEKPPHGCRQWTPPIWERHERGFVLREGRWH